MLRHGHEEGRALATSVVQTFAARCGRENLEVFLGVFEDERDVLRAGLRSFLGAIAGGLGAQDKQLVCRSFFEFCRRRPGSFWLVEFWLSHDSICSFSLQNDESLELALDMFFDFFCDLLRDVVGLLRRDDPARTGRPPANPSVPY